MRISHIFIVVAQVALIFFIAYFGKVWGNVYSNIATVSAVAIVFWTIASLGFYASPFPEVRKKQKLVTGGPFRFARHPIYSAGLLATLGWAANRPSVMVFAAWLALVVLLVKKIEIEEKSLLGHFPEYKDYRKKTKKLIPGIY